LLLQVPFSELEQYTAFFDQKNYWLVSLTK
jgi:hypothetical protein